MITAKEARERIDALVFERIKEEKKAIEEKINKAVERGQSGCWLGGWISQSMEDWIKSFGYNVERSQDGDVRISW